MNIKIHDDVTGFHNGTAYKGKVMGIGSVITIRQCCGKPIISVPRDSILKVNGHVFSDRPVEVYEKEIPKNKLIAQQMADGFQRIIDKEYPETDN